ALRSIGMINHADEAPVLLRKKQDKAHPNVTVWHFRNNGTPLHTWENCSAEIETALCVIVVGICYGKNNQRILLSTVPAGSGLPERIVWKDRYLSPRSFELMLGRSYTGDVTVNLADIPHILLGGATGSGKSVLLKCLIMQAYRKGASVAIADFKGGVDFPLSWREKCRMCFNEKALIELLDSYVSTLEERKRLFGDAGIANLDEYNKANGTRLKRYILACDEIAEVLDKTGLTKEQKETVAQIESRLSLIARQGRAFGIHLILATQRPDANILSGQIRNNINCRICGRADNVLSQIILDNTDAADQIPKHAKGRFMLHDGTVFQGFWLENTEL
ncbi:MAG: type IV secretion system DNA-binding domain-containing protein, partial [Oscillospiraceae bacterium]|nr:type IV secretion system DNA-binding domain-containing protein [Oscillospiraceae bacterium]